jgi:kynureninase
MGVADSFEMGPRYHPAPGARALLSGTPPILAMVPLHANLDMLAAAGVEAVRAKSVLLTGYLLDLADEWLAPYGVSVASPRDPDRRGGHVTLHRPGFEALLAPLWEGGVLPDFRRPDGLRLGPAPLSTSFGEVYRGVAVLRELLEKQQ